MTSEPRRVAVLGSTGSIGRQALQVIQANPDRFEVVALVAGSDEAQLREQAERTGVSATALGSDGAVRMAQLPEVDVVLNAVVGAAGLRASLAALESGKCLALANKESLIAGGEVCLAAAERGGGTIVPVDSEHAALAQCLEGRDRSTIDRLVLTASGGPFRDRRDLDEVTPEDALAHPTWSMGPKITTDSATLMNKGFEIIEAHFLFDFPYDRIGVFVHPQSVVHGIVELVDGSMLMQAAPTDMRIPIASALSHPERIENSIGRTRLSDVRSLDFEEVDHERFPAVGLAYEAGRQGGSATAVLNAANEIAVQAFLDRRLSFTGIVETVKAVLDRHEVTQVKEIEAVEAADRWARAQAASLIERQKEVL